MYDDFDHHKSDIILVCGWITTHPPRTTTLPIVNHIANKHVTQSVRSNYMTQSTIEPSRRDMLTLAISLPIFLFNDHLLCTAKAESADNPPAGVE